MPSNHPFLCHPLPLPPSIFSSIRVFSNESALHVRWPKYWCFSFSITPANEYLRLISFRIDWLDLIPLVQSPHLHQDTLLSEVSPLISENSWKTFICVHKIFSHLSTGFAVPKSSEAKNRPLFTISLTISSRFSALHESIFHAREAAFASPQSCGS